MNAYFGAPLQTIGRKKLNYIKDMNDKITITEIKAFQIMYKAGLVDNTTNTNGADYHKAADDLILIAEKIKAERMTASMK